MIENDNTMKYKGFTAGIHYSDAAGDKVFWGKFLGVTDSITFHGESVKELEAQFHDAADAYVEVASVMGRDVQAEVVTEEERLKNTINQAVIRSIGRQREVKEVIACAVRSWQDKEGYEKSETLLLLRQKLKDAKNYRPESSRGCVLCECVNGKRVKTCGYHDEILRGRKNIKELESIIKNGEALLDHHPACTESADHPCNCGLTEYELRRIEMGG